MEGSESVLGWMMDKVMFKLIGEQIIYNVSWEDPRIDRALLRIQSDDRILMLTSAGCNVLDYLIDGPAKIVAADLNPRQNALLELKLACLNALEYDEFWAIFGESSAAAFLAVYEEKLRPLLSEASASFWDASGESFFEKYMWRGMSGRAAEALVRLARVLEWVAFWTAS